ncbi:uncharacterized protein G2W53_036975 [Senna tora]|uniref:C2H2-type domain-containing protein n=1 Tax=Senna tora TaxID=362788 RepID=A0A834W5M4_9FABA|nr:uncharacterized protein G2W53_036975 [Senna tora]
MEHEDEAPAVAAPPPLIPHCIYCHRSFHSVSAIRSHNHDSHRKKTFECSRCHSVFSRSAVRTEHQAASVCFLAPLLSTGHSSTVSSEFMAALFFRPLVFPALWFALVFLVCSSASARCLRYVPISIFDVLS